MEMEGGHAPGRRRRRQTFFFFFLVCHDRSHFNGTRKIEHKIAISKSVFSFFLSFVFWPALSEPELSPGEGAWESKQNIPGME